MQDYLIFKKSMRNVQQEFDRIAIAKKNMVHPSRIAALPHTNDNEKLRHLGFDVDNIKPGQKHALLSTLLQLEKINRKPVVTRTDLTSLKI